MQQWRRDLATQIITASADAERLAQQRLYWRRVGQLVEDMEEQTMGLRHGTLESPQAVRRALGIAHEMVRIIESRHPDPVPDPAPRRGQCLACGLRYKLRKDGTVTSHLLGEGADKHRCIGSYGPPLTGSSR